MPGTTVNATGGRANAIHGGVAIAPTTSLADLSFELAGPTPGTAASWAWNRLVSFRYARFESPTGWTRFEGFEMGWGADPFVDAIVTPGNGAAFVFGQSGPVPVSAETFERGWRMPATPAPDGSHAGNETTLYLWEGGPDALFNGTLPVEDFEEGWETNEAYVWSFSPSLLSAAPFTYAVGGPQPVDTFESNWKGNESYLFASGSLSAASFQEFVTSQAFEDFSAVMPDQPITFSAPSTIIAPSYVLPFPPPVGGYPAAKATFYNGGGVGALPPEIDSRDTYFILLPLLAGGFQFNISTTATGSPLVFTGGSGNNFFKSDTSRFWTLTDVGV